MQKNSNLPFSQELHIATLAAAEARKVLTHYFGNLANVEEKYMAGLVSEADRESEAIIKEVILKAFPHHRFLGEEGSYQGNAMDFDQIAPDQLTWVVDPLDGTTNYVHRFPIFCSSLALVQGHQPVVGLIDVPLLNETYSAVRGSGAFKNGKSILASKRYDLKTALVATGFFSEKEDSLQEALNIFGKVVRSTRGVRRAGAAAFDLCMVASGVFDCFWEKNLSPWDTAAGQLLVQEAGGLVSTYRGAEFHPWKNSIVASNPALHSQFLNLLAQDLRPDTH